MGKTKALAFYSWKEVPVVINLAYAAVILNANPEVVRSYLSDGTLKGFKIGKEWRINKSDLMDFVGAREERTA